MGKKVLFIVPHRTGRSPGQRFRFEQYYDVLKDAGFDITVSNLLDEKGDSTFYAKASYFQKGAIVIKSLWKRYADLIRANDYDIVFIYREAIMLGFTWFEKHLSKTNAKLILDFDDAIWLKDVSEGNRNIAFLKRPEKTFKLVEMADLVIVGNQYIADKCKSYNTHVRVFPTTIDLSYHKAKPVRNIHKKICIGWTGTETTLKHFDTALPALEKIYNEFKEKVCFKLICDKKVNYSSIGLTSIQWSKESEIEQLSDIDIGIMPLPDNEWTRAKCGFKALQYLSLEIPAIVSGVGVNTDIIDHNENGFVANTQDEWYTYLKALIESEELRKSFGKRGRIKIEESYSKQALSNDYIEIFESCVSPVLYPEV